jgi:ATP-dependent helicase/nuclease subunit A
MKQRAADWISAMARAPGLLEMLLSVRELPAAQLSIEDTAALHALTTLLKRAAAELLLEFAASGNVDYAHVAAAARQSLTEAGEPTDLALRFGAQLRHILVDEFQDTSYEQFELLRALTVGWEPGDGRTLFVVGDPMQSIYQFREAEVGLFLRARARGIGTVTLRPLQLRRNFRSRPALVHWVNECFGQLFPSHDDARLAAIRYLSSFSARTEEAAGDTGATLHRCDASDASAEAQRVVQIVSRARTINPHCSIALLVASRAHASAIVPALMQAGFALRGVDLEPLAERPVVRDLSALTRVLLHGADRSAWLALLRAPWCGMSLAECEHLGGDLEETTFASLQRLADSPAAPAALRLRLARVCAALVPALEGAERGEALWLRVESSWLRLGGPACCEQERDLEDARSFLDALAQHDDPARLAGEGLQELIAGLHSSAAALEGAIDIMTMHAAKGLEWDVVLLPGLGRRTMSDADPLLHWIELPGEQAGSELLLAPIRASDKEQPAALATYIKHLRRRRAALERVRQLYVAATRAREALHLLAAFEPNLQPAAQEPPSARLVAACAVAGHRHGLCRRSARAPPDRTARGLPPCRTARRARCGACRRIGASRAHRPRRWCSVCNSRCAHPPRRPSTAGWAAARVRSAPSCMPNCGVWPLCRNYRGTWARETISIGWPIWVSRRTSVTRRRRRSARRCSAVCPILAVAGCSTARTAMRAVNVD